MTTQFSFLEPQAPPAAPKPSLKGTSVIYEPRGRAREYAPLACNIYKGCDHQCLYCYAPSATRRQRADFVASAPRPGFLSKLERDAAKHAAVGTRERILLCFTCDPYQHLDCENRTTRKAIEILKRNGLNIQVLTKGGRRALRDLDLFTPDDAFATTLTLLDDDNSRKWEPRAALPYSRIDAIRQFHTAGIPTWLSLEPVLDPAIALEIISQTHEFVDLFKVGKLNYHPRAEKINWPLFAQKAIELLMSLGYRRNLDPDRLESGQFYIKQDLARYLSNTAR